VFRCAGGGACRFACAAECGADPARGHFPGWDSRLPGEADGGGERAGEPQLVPGGDDDPGPPVGGLGCAQQRGGPAELLLEEPEAVLDVEAAQVGLPEPGRPLLPGGGLSLFN
jgi:hypothetical protein